MNTPSPTSHSTVSGHLIDPDLQFLLSIPRLQLFEENDLPFARQTMETVCNSMPIASDVVVTERIIPGPADSPDIKLLIVKPADAVGILPVIYDVHGGGYVLGSARSSLPSISQIVNLTGCCAISVDYRLAPETSFPGNVEDCYTGLKYVYNSAADLGVDPSRIAVHGVSSGGGLAAGLCLMVRDRGEISVLFQLLVCPMLDDRTGSTVFPSKYCGEFSWTKEHNKFGWSSLLGKTIKPGDDNVSPYAAPSRAKDLSGLPPTFIACGSIDLFCEESIEYAHRLIVAGVPTELHIYPGAPHSFLFAPTSPVSISYKNQSISALKKALKIQ